MLWVYDLKYFTSFSAGTFFIRQNLTYKEGPRTERIKITKQMSRINAANETSELDIIPAVTHIQKESDCFRDGL